MESYLLQLEQVNLALSDDNCPNREELSQLQSDLLDLIQLNQEEFAANEENSAVQSENDDTNDDTTSNSDSELEYSDDNLTVGSRCRAPYLGQHCSSQRFLSYHNAIIFEIDPVSSDVTDRKVTVMFCNPVTKSMQPCPYFLNGTCNFAENCRYSHGECVSVSDLKEYEEPDFENVTENTVCLVKQNDDLWKLGRITAISRDEESAAVCITETNEEVRAPFSCLLPIASDYDNNIAHCSLDGGIDEEFSSDNEQLGLNGCGSSKQQNACHAWSNDNLGGWEKHTKGVASKLMVKMGYIPGQGLGKDSDGRLVPIEARVLPKGHSLDRCAEDSAKAATKDPKKTIKRKKRRAKLKERRNQQNKLKNLASTNSNLFDIINKRLSSTNTKQQKTDHHSAAKISENFSQFDDKELNVKLFNVQEKIRAEEKQGQQYKSSISRNESKDRIVHGQSKSKLSQSQERLADLKIREKALMNEIANRKSHKKLCQF